MADDDRATLLDWLDAHDPLRFTNHRDPLLAGDPRWAVRSNYQEQCLLPLIGPTSLWLLRRLQVGAGQVGTVPHDLLAASVGLGRRTGRSSQLTLGLARLVKWRLARVDGDLLVVNAHVGPLSPQRVESLGRLHPTLAAVHDHFLAAVPA